MAAEKRKLASERLTASTTKKRQKTETKTEQEQPAIPKARTSILAKEQAAFPRGGAGALSTLEKKQIRAQAVRDVAREADHDDLFSSRPAQSGPEDDSDLELPTDKKNELGATKKKSKKRSKKTETKKDEADTVRAESLAYKRLEEGTILLGCINSITPNELLVSLPNNLVGHVPLTAISDAYTRKVEHALKDDTSDAENSDEEGDEELDLGKHFNVGQYLKVAVTALSEERPGRGDTRKKIVLSIEPSLVNAGLERKILSPGCVIQAAITSVEDHGVAVDVGLADCKGGFIPRVGLKSNEATQLLQGAVLLCSVTKDKSKGKIVQLSLDHSSSTLLKNASSVDAYTPGTLADILLTDITSDGLIGKIMGMVDATADVVHSGHYSSEEDLSDVYSIGQKVSGRIVASLSSSESKKLLFSTLKHIVDLEAAPSQNIPLSSIVSTARVTHVSSGLGVYLSLSEGAHGFAHISRLADKTIEVIHESSGAYKVGSEHKARALEFNSIDGLYTVSLQPSVLDQQFLRYQDVKPGQVVKASVEKLLHDESGVKSIVLRLAPGISGLVVPLHFSDVTVKNPEKKFKEGMVVTARVLSVDCVRRNIRLTLKKSLINSDQTSWADFTQISVGDASTGMLVKVEMKGALLQFYGSVKGYLPVSEMSEAHIKDAREHFNVGQVLSVRAITVDGANNRLTLSARERSTTTSEDVASVPLATLVDGVVFEKSKDDLLVRLQPSGATARLSIVHMADGSEKAQRKLFDTIRVNQTLKELVVLEVQKRGKLIVVSNKKTLRQASVDGQLLSKFEDLKEDKTFTGYVASITPNAVFVRFAAGITGVIKKLDMPQPQQDAVDFDLKPMQAVTAKVLSIDYSKATPIFRLTMKAKRQPVEQQQGPNSADEASNTALVEPVDPSMKSKNDLNLGARMNVKITSIKDTQVNVEIARGVQGRIDVSEVFDDIEKIADRKHPLKALNKLTTKGTGMMARIIGTHDTRTHRFLPLSHRSSKSMVYEMTIRPSVLESETLTLLALSDIKVGQSYLAFVNNVMDNALMVNITPSIRGRIRASDVSDDLGLATNLSRNFPTGSALQVRVLAVDVEKNRLDLSARSSDVSRDLTLDQIKPGDVFPGRITKITDRSLVVQLSDNLAGVVELIDLADDFTQADTARFQRNEIVRVSVVKVDKANKKIFLSTRPSSILGAEVEVADPDIKDIKDIQVGNVRRGFVNSISDKGLFVSLSRDISAFVRITNLSDEYLKEWKDHFQKDQMVTGKVISVDYHTSHVQMSLKKAHVQTDYKPPLSFAEIQVGAVVEAKVAKVESFGVFIVVNNSENVRGLCHRSEIADSRIEDVTKLGFAEGDAVKAKVLKVDPEHRRINFGMKASYFLDEVDDEKDEDEDADSNNEGQSDVDASDEEDGGIELQLNSDDEMIDFDGLAEGSGSDDEDEGMDVDEVDASQDDTGATLQQLKALSVPGFDWEGTLPSSASEKKRSVDTMNAAEAVDLKKTKKKKRADIQVDRTGDLDAEGPQTADDFERLLLGESEPLQLWLQYMAFHLDLGEVDQARQIGERALRSIKLSQETEKTAIWFALLNLENTFGDDESITATFERACETCDAEEVHSRLASIYIHSGKYQKADELFQQTLKKFKQNPKLWTNYAVFLFDTMEDAPRARALLPRALQALPEFTHFDMTSKFAQLEFKTKTGVPEEGRTRFQGLLSLYPKRLDLFNVMIDLETKIGDYDQARGLFEQVLSRSLKPAKAKPFFQRWSAFEKEHGDQRKMEEVDAKAAQWVASYQKQQA